MYPYIGKVLVDYLTSKLDNVRVATTVPEPRPARLVTLTVVPGGPSDKPDYLSWRRVIVHCWDDEGEEQAGEFAETVRDHLAASRYARIGIRKVEIIGEPGRYDDPDDGQPRMQLTADFLLRAKT